jgi:hypothetical protein
VNNADLVRLVDALEDRTDGYLRLDAVFEAAGEDVSNAVREHILLVDYRTQADGAGVTVCRLNRRHPLVAKLTGW